MNSECSEFLAGLESWYSTEAGRYLHSSLCDRLGEPLATVFGYHLLEVGFTGAAPLNRDSRINHRVYCAPRAGEGVDLVALGEELPIESDSVDTVIAHHCLDFGANPHQTLRELQRVLTPQGHLIIIGFNPYSLLGAGLRGRGLSKSSIWRHYRPLSERRLTDWLHLLGCEVEDSAHSYHVPLFGGVRTRNYLQRASNWSSDRNLPGGGVYAIHAIKQVCGHNRPQRALRFTRQRLIGLAVPKPSATPSPTPQIPAARSGESAP